MHHSLYNTKHFWVRLLIAKRESIIAIMTTLHMTLTVPGVRTKSWTWKPTACTQRMRRIIISRVMSIWTQLFRLLIWTRIFMRILCVLQLHHWLCYLLSSLLMDRCNSSSNSSICSLVNYFNLNIHLKIKETINFCSFLKILIHLENLTD